MTNLTEGIVGIVQLGVTRSKFEFQRLHVIEESLQDQLLQDRGVPCRIYIPVGAQKDMATYLVRRPLENGANSSFVNQIVDHCNKFEQAGKLLKKVEVSSKGRFVSPAVLKVSGIEEMEEEVFGPVLHWRPSKPRTSTRWWTPSMPGAMA